MASCAAPEGLEIGLKCNRTLKTLSMQSNKMSKASGVAIGAGLSFNTTLTELNVDSACIVVLFCFGFDLHCSVVLQKACRKHCARAIEHKGSTSYAFMGI